MAAISARLSPASSPNAPAELLRALDGLLFAGGWFCLDARNTKVPGVRPGTLDQALALVGRGAVTTVVGQLRPEVAGVDVDAPGELGVLAARSLAEWCASRGLWHLVRASGGGPGRAHVLCVPGVHAGALAAHVQALRGEFGLRRSQLELRRQLRPLSAPHRRTGVVPAVAAPTGAMQQLEEALGPVPERVVARRAAASGAAGPTVGVPRQRDAGGGPPHPLAPLPRPARPLPPGWAAYLTAGRRAAAAAGLDRDPGTRSQLELEATFQLVVAGYTEPQAWTAITAAHPTAFPKARARGRRWWWHVWNRAVLDADSWLRARRAAATDSSPDEPASGPAPLEATLRARQLLEAVWRSWPARTRHTDLEVLSVVLDRMDRARATSIAVPQRDLVLDCAVSSRTTVRASLARLQATGLLRVVPTYQPGTTDTAHTLQLPTPLPFPAQAGLGTAVLPTGPSWCQPPQRRLPLALRRSLGLPASALLARLPDHATAAGVPLEHLAQLAGTAAPDQGRPTPAQLRTLRMHLDTLARAGLAVVDELGRWRATETSTVRDTELCRVGYVLDQAVRGRIDAERSEFRARFSEQGRTARWHAQRHAALARAAKAAQGRQRGWWRGLDPAQQQRRRVEAGRVFEALSPVEQARRKQRLAEHRALAGLHERHRYDTWLTSQLPADLERRSLARALAYAARPRHEQQQLVAGWTEHRARWSLPHPRRTQSARTPAAPPGAIPEAALLRRPAPSFDELALFDQQLTPSRDAAVASRAS